MGTAQEGGSAAKRKSGLEPSRLDLSSVLHKQWELRKRHMAEQLQNPLNIYLFIK